VPMANNNLNATKRLYESQIVSRLEYENAQLFFIIP